MRLAVIGSRDVQDKIPIYYWLERLLKAHPDLEIVSGGARGVDSLAEEFAYKHQLPITVYAADWDKYGPSAGYRRNSSIWEYADAGIAFWDGKSKGTAHSFGLAALHLKPLQLVLIELKTLDKGVLNKVN